MSWDEVATFKVQLFQLRLLAEFEPGRWLRIVPSRQLHETYFSLKTNKKE